MAKPVCMKNTNEAAYSKKNVSTDALVEVDVASKVLDMHCNSASVVGVEVVVPSAEVVVSADRQYS